ncbi:unnamed protein product [Rotaria sp. Silwood1]|nr:unnamed protein product [Rotaria sp. Silwood1]CAF1689750.1 unnamed protein product [Rotaria sp. Silwood1]CAF3851089.1 unnamed protein product [Rotaria sp. Silwood1]CAF4978242.1 unnamed protein product [Rotaria sp. Silwood1]
MIDDEYTYEVITTRNDASLCAQLVAEEYVVHNPLAAFDHIPSDWFFNNVSWPLFADVVDEQLSFLVRHRISGEIVGAIAAGDLFLFHEKHPYDPTGPPTKFGAGDLFDELDHLFISRDFGQELKPNLVLQITITVVRAQHSGKGVASRLSIAMCEHARNTKGFEYAFVQAAHPATQQLYVNKMSGQIVTIVDSTTWLWKKKDDGLSRPYKDYKGGLISNILINLKSDVNK